MAMFVLVVDTSLMNVSISAVIKDLHTTASGVQSAIALEALVSAAFILTNSKLGDLMGRRRAYVIGLLGYAVGAVAMTLAQNLNTIIIFWAIIGGLGASLLLPAMQSLIHGNFTGGAQKRAYALVGASAAIAAAVGPLLGGFLTTYLSWRVGFGLEALIILVVLSQIRLVKDVPYTGPRQIDVVGSILSIVGMGGLVLGILVWQEGGQYVGLIMGIGAATLAAFAYWLVWRKRHGKPTLLDPGLFKHLNFRIGISQQMLQQITLGGAMIALPLFLQMTLEYNAMQAGLSLAPLSLSMFGVAMLAGRKAGKFRPAQIVLTGFALSTVGMAAIIPLVPRVDSGWYLVIPLVICGSGLGMLVSQLNNFTLAPISEERVSEAAGVNSAAGSFGLSFGLAIAGGLMLWALALSFNHQVQASPGDPTGPATADLRGTRARCRDHEQHATPAADRRGTQGRAGGSPGHQHPRPEPLPPDRTPRSGSGLTSGFRKLVPHAPAPRHHTVSRHRRCRPRVDPTAILVPSDRRCLSLTGTGPASGGGLPRTAE